MRTRTLQSYLNKWQRGTITKSAIERELGVERARGKYITRLWAERLNVDTRYGVVTPVGQSLTTI